MTFSQPRRLRLGKERGVSFKSPINGALIAPPAFYPGVNAWATENPPTKLVHSFRSALRNQQQFSRSLSAFEIAVRLLHFSQWILFVYSQF